MQDKIVEEDPLPEAEGASRAPEGSEKANSASAKGAKVVQLEYYRSSNVVVGGNIVSDPEKNVVNNCEDGYGETPPRLSSGETPPRPLPPAGLVTAPVQPASSGPYGKFAPWATVAVVPAPRVAHPVVVASASHNNILANCTPAGFIMVFFTLVAVILGLALGLTLGRSSSSSGSSNGGSGGSGDAGTFVIAIQSANTKQVWMNAIAASYNAANVRLADGRLSKVVVYNTGSTLNATLAPSIWSPQTVQWVTLQEASDRRTYVSNKASLCTSSTSIPVGIAMWSSKAAALGWPSAPISLRQIVALTVNATLGWGALGAQYASWGRFLMGHGNPLSSNSGRLTIVATLQALSASAAPLNATFINSSVAHTGVHALESAVMHLGALDTDLLDRMVLRGPGYLHAVATYEANVIAYNTKYYPSSLPEPLAFIYPSDGTLWMDNPLCLVDAAPWATPAAMEAARLFVAYALRPEGIAAMVQAGIRPSNTSVDVTAAAGSPFSLANGVIPAMSLETVAGAPYPSDATMQSAIALWVAEKKRAAVFMALDTSGSMSSGGDIPGVSPISALRTSAATFVASLGDADILSIVNFGETPTLWSPVGAPLSTCRATMLAQISQLYASGGTALYNSMTLAFNALNATRTADTAAGIQRNYLLLVMTDGVDNGGGYDNLISALPSSSDPAAPHAFTIGFGANALGSATVLQSIAEATNGHHYAATTSNLATLFASISNEI